MVLISFDLIDSCHVISEDNEVTIVKITVKSPKIVLLLKCNSSKF